MAKVNRFDFGSIVIDGKRYGHDVVVLPDGTVKERKTSKAKYGAHIIGKVELEVLAKTKPEIFIIGTGTSGMARLSPRARLYGREVNLNPVVLPSSEAVAKLNQLVDEGKRVAALIHVTC